MRNKTLTMLLLGCCCRGLVGQETTPAPYVLHVYTNLIQVPTLVLSDALTPVPPVAKDRFEVRIDSGTPFHPTSLRREGNDPIALAILLDASGDADELLKTFAASVPLLAPNYLHAQDHVSVFVVDCKLMRSAYDLPATAETLNKALTVGLQVAGLHGEKKSRGACGRTLRFRDALSQVIHSLGDLPGRRVLLAVADGHDGGSSVGWSAVGTYAASKGVAVFGLRDKYRDPPGSYGSSTGGRLGAQLSSDVPTDEDLFALMCDSNGGLLVSTTRYALYKDLVQFATNLRDRYIVEFPRPNESQSGLHDIRIQVSKTRYVVHSTGVSVSLPNPTELNDPNTVPVAKSPATYGKRKPLEPSH